MSRLSILPWQAKCTSYSSRIQYLVIHATELNFAASVHRLTHEVSVHYLIPQVEEMRNLNCQVIQLVDECDQAWHAGLSAWERRTNINDTSIGIEIVNQSAENSAQAFQQEQIAALVELSRDILARYPSITPTRVLGHSDIAPLRKQDPGPLFPWQELAAEGIGMWCWDNELIALEAPFSLEVALDKLALLGYSTTSLKPPHKEPRDLASVLIQAFQMRFRPSLYDGVLDLETCQILQSLVNKYA